MPDLTPERAYRRIEAGSSGALPEVLRALVPFVLVSSIVVMFAPSTLRHAVPGWHGGESAESSARVAAFCVLAVTLSASAVASRRRARAKQRETWSAFALEVGGALTDAPIRVGAGAGWEDGLRVAYTIEGRPVVLTCYGPKSSDRFTRLGATIPLRQDVQFQILANTTANRVLMSAAVWSPVLKMASREARSGPGGAERARALERMRFLAADSTAIGDASFDRAFLLKATDAGTARDVVGDPSVRTALEQLVRRDRYFRLSLVGPGAPGPAQLEVELAGRQVDVDRLRGMHALLLAVIARLDRSGVLETGARRAS